MSRDEKLISSLMSDLSSYPVLWHGNGGMLKEIFSKYFLKEDTPWTEEQQDEQPFGIGTHPDRAIQVYVAMLNGQEQIGKVSNRLGLIHHTAVPVDKSKAENHYSTAIEVGSKKALFNRTVLLAEEQEGRIDLSVMDNVLESGNSTAMNNLAIAFDLGKGAGHYPKNAELFYKAAIEVDQHPIAMFNLAVMYKCDGRDIRSDAKSTEWMNWLRRPGTDTSGLCILRNQITKFLNLKSGESCSWSVKLEEIDGCLANVKVIEDQ